MDLVEDAAARTLADSFADDPLQKLFFQGIPKEQMQELVSMQSRMILRSAGRRGALQLLDGQPKAVLIGLDSGQESRRDELSQMLGMLSTGSRVAGVRGVGKMIGNSAHAKQVLSFSWQQEFVSGNYHRLKVIAIHKSIRGTGAFRRLISPTLERCDRLGIPVVLETHNPENVPRYEHFGFRLVKTLESPKTDVRQYCMVRSPAQSSFT